MFFSDAVKADMGFEKATTLREKVSPKRIVGNIGRMLRWEATFDERMAVIEAKVAREEAADLQRRLEAGREATKSLVELQLGRADDFRIIGESALHMSMLFDDGPMRESFELTGFAMYARAKQFEAIYGPRLAQLQEAS